MALAGIRHMFVVVLRGLISPPFSPMRPLTRFIHIFLLAAFALLRVKRLVKGPVALGGVPSRLVLQRRKGYENCTYFDGAHISSRVDIRNWFGNGRRVCRFGLDVLGSFYPWLISLPSALLNLARRFNPCLCARRFSQVPSRRIRYARSSICTILSVRK